MKKNLFFVFVAFIAISVFSQELGDKVYKEVTSNGEKVFKWLKYSELTEYDISVNEIHEKRSNGRESWYDYEFYNNGKVKTQKEFSTF